MFVTRVQALTAVIMTPAGTDPDYSKTNMWAALFCGIGVVTGIANILQVNNISTQINRSDSSETFLHIKIWK